MRRAALLALLAVPAAGAASLEVVLEKGRPAHAVLESAVDDAHLENPVGYFPAEKPATRIVRRITVENVGQAPVEDPDIRLNGEPLLPVADPLDALGVRDVRDLLSLFVKWRDRAVHATTDLDANHDPLAVLQVIGAGFCGDDARALAAITVANGAEVRFARLNGHSVAEHRLGGDWMLLDGDQNLFYLDWDNRTPVSEDDIQADPLLALRTQVFGRQSRWEPISAWQNTSRFEFVDHARAQKIFRLKKSPPPRHWQLWPGEKIVIQLDESPDRATASSEMLRANAVLREVICRVEFQPHDRSGKISLPYPQLSGKAGEPVYEAKAGASAIACQAVRAQFPTLRSGKNLIDLKTEGMLRVAFDYESASLIPPLPATAEVDLPHIRIHAKGADQLWWQISADRDFRLVPPNFERVERFTPQLTLMLIDQTFLSAGESYFFRVKVRCAGVWSDWSHAVAFTARKPARPVIVAAERADGDQTRLRWKPEAGEILVFGSDRLDFLPEIFGTEEMTRLENGAVRESRPNRNLLATVSAMSGEAYVPVRACYRLIARESGEFSVPSALVRVPKAPKAKVLQTRHEKPVGALTGRDVAVEMEIP